MVHKKKNDLGLAVAYSRGYLYSLSTVLARTTKYFSLLLFYFCPWTCIWLLQFDKVDTQEEEIVATVVA